MAFQHKNGCGTLFNNDRKSKDTHPDMTGIININGNDLDFAAWKKKGKSGKEFLGVRIKSSARPAPAQPPQQQGWGAQATQQPQMPPVPQQQAPTTPPPMQDNLPF